MWQSAERICQNDLEATLEYGLAFSENDSSLGQIVWGQLHTNFVTRNNTDEVLPHSTSNVREHFRSGFQLNAKPGVRKSLGYSTFDFECFFVFSHNVPRTSLRENVWLEC